MESGVPFSYLRPFRQEVWHSAGTGYRFWTGNNDKKSCGHIAPFQTVLIRISGQKVVLAEFKISYYAHEIKLTNTPVGYILITRNGIPYGGILVDWRLSYGWKERRKKSSLSALFRET